MKVFWLFYRSSKTPPASNNSQYYRIPVEVTTRYTPPSITSTPHTFFNITPPRDRSLQLRYFCSTSVKVPASTIIEQCPMAYTATSNTANTNRVDATLNATPSMGAM